MVYYSLLCRRWGSLCLCVEVPEINMPLIAIPNFKSQKYCHLQCQCFSSIMKNPTEIWDSEFWQPVLLPWHWPNRESGSLNLNGGREKCKLQQILRVLKIPLFHRKLWHVDFSAEGEVYSFQEKMKPEFAKLLHRYRCTIQRASTWGQTFKRRLA